MNNPIVLLLDAYESNVGAVKEVLNHLEEQRIVSVRFIKRNALSFAADVTPEPSALVMYLDRSELVSIMFTENAYLLHLIAKGKMRLGRRIFNKEVMPAGQGEALDLVHFLCDVLSSSRYNLCVDN